MKIISFESLERYTVAIHKKAPYDIEGPSGNKITNYMDSGVLDYVQDRFARYWIPINKIEILKEKKGHYFINNIEVNEENFKKVLRELENEV